MMRSRLWLLVLCPILFAQTAGGEPIGRALQVVPEVRYGFDGAGETNKLKANDPIVERTRVVTKGRAGTEIQVGFPPGKHGIVRLGPKTTFTFERWLVGAVGGEYSLRLYAGQIIAYLWPETGEHTVTIDTPAGPVTLHGTAVYLDVSPIDGSTFVYVQEGYVTVESLAGEPVTVRAGQQVTLVPGQPPTDPVSVSPGAGPDLMAPGDAWLVEPLEVDLNDPRLDLPK